jgi:hypothetical protein
MAQPYKSKVFLLEERELPDGKWAADTMMGSDDLDEAIEMAEEWANMEYDDDVEVEVRIVEFEKVGAVRLLRKGQCKVVSPGSGKR